MVCSYCNGDPNKASTYCDDDCTSIEEEYPEEEISNSWRC